MAQGTKFALHKRKGRKTPLVKRKAITGKLRVGKETLAVGALQQECAFNYRPMGAFKEGGKGKGKSSVRAQFASRGKGGETKKCGFLT